MSGGHFQHNQHHIFDIADQIQNVIDNNNDKTENEYGEVKGCHFNETTIKHFKDAVDKLKEAYIYAHRVDFLLSGDDGELNFLIRLLQELDDLKCKKNNT